MSGVWGHLEGVSPYSTVRGEVADLSDDASVAPVTFEEFVATRGPALLRLARLLTGDEGRAEDAVQDVFVLLISKWASVARADNIDAYVRRMLVNRVNAWWRRPARRESAHDMTALATVATVVDSSARPETDDVIDRDVLMNALAALPPKQRIVLVLRHFDGCSDVEIAHLLRCPDSTVRSHARRGLAALRWNLEQGEAR